MGVYGFINPIIAGQFLIGLPGGGDRRPKKPIREPPRKPHRPGRDVPEPVPIDDPKPSKPKDSSASEYVPTN